MRGYAAGIFICGRRFSQPVSRPWPRWWRRQRPARPGCGGGPSAAPAALGSAKAAATSHNAASVLRAGRIEQTYAKQYLPNYEVFDERRYFVPGTDSCVRG